MKVLMCVLLLDFSFSPGKCKAGTVASSKEVSSNINHMVTYESASETFLGTTQLYSRELEGSSTENPSESSSFSNSLKPENPSGNTKSGGKADQEEFSTPLYSEASSSENLSVTEKHPLVVQSMKIKETPKNYQSGTHLTTNARESTSTPKPCTYLERPIVVGHKDTSINIEDPIIYWQLNTSNSNCESIRLHITCTNIDGDSKIFKEDADETVSKILKTVLKELKNTTYSCEGKLKSASVESMVSNSVDVFNEIKDRITINDTTSSATSFFVEWSLPADSLHLTYTIEIVELEALHFIPDCGHSNKSLTNTTDESWYNFTNASPHFMYSVKVSTEVRGNIITSDVVNVSTSVAAPGEPRNLSIDDDPQMDDGSPNVSKIVNWIIPCSPNGIIEKYSIEVEGYYTLDDSLIDNRTISAPVGPDQETVEEVISGLKASSNYTIKIKAVGKNSLEGPEIQESFTTRDAIPRSPIINITYQSSSRLEIEWHLPDNDVYGKITDYSLRIIPIGLVSGPKPENCQSQNGVDTTWYNSSYIFDEAVAFYNYEVYVNASTSRGTGPAGFRLATTTSSAPDAPRNVKRINNPYPGDTSPDVRENISWEMPCLPNGLIQKYFVELTGFYEPNNSYKYHKLTNFSVEPEQESFVKTLESLWAATNYNLKVWAVGENSEIGNASIVSFITRDAIPGPPVLRTNSTNSTFTIVWDARDEKVGKIIQYHINVEPNRALYDIPDDCQEKHENSNFTQVEQIFIFNTARPYHEYNVEVAAETSKGVGKYSPSNIQTDIGVPENVRDPTYIIDDSKEEIYNASVTVKFKRPCHTYGHLKQISIKYSGKRGAQQIAHDGFVNVALGGQESIYIFYLKPEYNYNVSIITENDKYPNSVNFSFTAPSGVPMIPQQYVQQSVQILAEGLDKARVTLEKGLLDNTNGDIRYVSLILSTRNEGGGKFKAWNNNTWPEVFRDEKYQLTENFWQPFDNDENPIVFVIGAGPTCGKSQKYCNGPLEEDTEYFLIIRMFTNGFYRDSLPIRFRTGKSWTSFILGMIFGLVTAGTLAVVAFMLWRRGVFQNIMKHIPTNIPGKPPRPAPTKCSGIPCHKFKHLEIDTLKLQEQFKELSEKAKEITAEKTNAVSVLIQNRRKNRYTNITPFDENRVKLLIDEDDEIGSDYINGSFIRGHSGGIEYIATQGPMATTTRDFWKMVLQENVTVIVMVSQFFENSKEKCHRYFPKNHETMLISDDMEIRCSTELHFGTYCVRHLQIQKDGIQATVTHMQFLDWPDFGVPVGSDKLLQFCYQVRERIEMDGGLMIVHCSAGVGRTGTLIATDILLQTANAGKNIDVFNTVLELRRQRVTMVQTDKQYILIFNLLKDHLDRAQTPDDIEHTYENVGMLPKSLEEDKNEEESNF
ncbi:hypothetical protein JTB14_032291 [Gonioctena quinquepunctata]|nr:hypothetical protein JTB14_032291 [Gonioctena quinquepunctata]